MRIRQLRTSKIEQDNMKGIVVCPPPEAAEIGIQMLEFGGNAFDAALAGAFVQMIVDPFMCGVGGAVKGFVRLDHLRG
jgi:gamma-glutamyltranspeptidase